VPLTASQRDQERDRQTAQGEAFVPRRIRDLEPGKRRSMFRDATDPRLEAWAQRERDRCADPSYLGLRYFVEQYGSIEQPSGDPDEIGGAIPFDLWEAQRDVLSRFLGPQILVVLKARRLGLSWLALHFALWLAIFAPFGRDVRIMIICKNEEDAKALLARMRRVVDRLPLYLRPELDTDNVTMLRFADTGGEIRSLPATERAARLETATLLLLDEFAFPPNGVARGIWRAALPTIEGGGRAIVISTGNGEAGDGAQFATLVRQGEAGELPNGELIFLDLWQRPGRTPEWRDAQRKLYMSDEEFEAEYPETIDQALYAARGPTVYPTSDVIAAVRIGELLDRWHAATINDGVEIGGDWGDFQTFATYAVPLNMGGVWVVDELPLMQVEPTRASKQILEHSPAGRDPGILRTAFDAAPRGTNKTFASVLRDYHRDQPMAYPDQHSTWAFGTYKQGGNDRRGVNTVGYLQMLFRNAHNLWHRIEHLPIQDQLVALDASVGVIAISPRCKVLLHQLRELRKDPETGKVVKPTLSPSDVLAGDHGPDALVALCAERAATFKATMEAAA
jgi:hypothetical protein